jgi:hypothetical protein
MAQLLSGGDFLGKRATKPPGLAKVKGRPESENI